jgi:hypothetical protein
VLAGLVAAAQASVALGVLLAAAWVALALRSWRSARAPGRARLRPSALVAFPVVVIGVQRLLAEPMTELARDRAIENSAPMIDDIESYRGVHGRYPPSLHAVWGDYDPDVIGIERYRYEPSGEAYNLFFEQPSFDIGARAFVMFNPRDEQALTSHDAYLLRVAPAELARGFSSARSLAEPHWKCFVFD